MFTLKLRRAICLCNEINCAKLAEVGRKLSVTEHESVAVEKDLEANSITDMPGVYKIPMVRMSHCD